MMSDDQERFLRRAAEANRERLAVAHREVVMEEEARKAVDVRENMARLKEQRLAKEAQGPRAAISEANQPPTRKPRRCR